jgi:hypothetical protein
MFKTTRMTLSVGNYKKAKKNGFAQWARVICHVSPVKPNGDVVLGISQSVEFWPDDQEVNKLLVLAEKNGEEISVEGKEWKRWKFEGDKIPEDYNDCFSFMGDLAWDVITFDEEMVKVVKEDDRIVKIVKDENKKPIVTKAVTFAYWHGPMISPGLVLSRQYREARVRRDYAPFSLIFNVVDDNIDNKAENAEEEPAAGED